MDTSAAMRWNSLPNELKCAITTDCFKKTTTPLAWGVFNGIGAHEGGPFVFIGGGGGFGFPPYKNFCGHTCSMVVPKACMMTEALL